MKNNALYLWQTKLLILIALILPAIRIFFLPLPLSVNDASRWNTVWSLCKNASYCIDQAPWHTVDKVFCRRHFYSSKHPFLATLAAGIVFVLQFVFGLSLTVKNLLVLRISLLLLNLFPFSIFLILYSKFLYQYFPKSHFFCLSVACFGTYLSSYCVTLNNHTLSSFSIFFAIFAWLKIHEGKSLYYYSMAGFFTSFAICNEPPCLLFAIFIVLYFFYKDKKRCLFYFFPAFVVPLIPYFLTSYIATGEIFFPFFKGFFYKGSYWIHPKGIDAARDPKHIYFFHMLFGHHGIFSLTPIFFFSLWEMLREEKKWKSIQTIGLCCFGILLAFYAWKTRNYGGVCQGLRWGFWLIPFWLFALPRALEKLNRFFYFVVWIALVISIFSSFQALVNPWSSSWLEKKFSYNEIGNRRYIMNRKFRLWSKEAHSPYGWISSNSPAVKIYRKKMTDYIMCIATSQTSQKPKWIKGYLMQKIPAGIQALRVSVKIDRAKSPNLVGLCLAFSQKWSVYFVLSQKINSIQTHLSSDSLIVQIPAKPNVWQNLAIDIHSFRKKISKKPIKLYLINYRWTPGKSTICFGEIRPLWNICKNLLRLQKNAKSFSVFLR